MKERRKICDRKCVDMAYQLGKWNLNIGRII